MLEYKMDLCDDSYFYILTPDESAKAFSYYVTEFGRYRARSEYYTRRDGKDAALLIFTISGAGEIEWKGQKCLAESGSAVVINCKQYHYYHTVSEEPWDFYWVHFDLKETDGFAKALMNQFTNVLLSDINDMYRYFAAIKNAYKTGGMIAWAEMSHAMSGMMTTMMRSLAHTANMRPLYRDEINVLAKYIRANYTKDLSMEEFVRVANLSRYHLIRTFRQQMGMPPYKYMHHCRINRAQQLLRSTNKTVAEIANEVGYNDKVNFIRHFKDIVGMTPTQYVANSILIS